MCIRDSYVVSPFAMTWDDENYYMVAYDSEAGIIKHYRVDKMEKISTLDEERDLSLIHILPQRPPHLSGGRRRTDPKGQ